MSMDKHYYVIAGYDLTNYKTEEYDEWKWTDQGESYLCYQRQGQIQLFDDPCSGQHLYFGYILAAGDEYYFETEKFNMIDVQDAFDEVTWELYQLQRAGVINLKDKDVPVFQVIVFVEAR